MDVLSRAQSPPNSASTTGTRKARLFQPLSNHGMPRTPLPTSPGGSIRSHRFDQAERSPRHPGSPGSPPMSARTFATFFSSNDSEPSYSPTEPSYSPRAPSHFSGSTLAGSPQPTPSLPPIPHFERVQFDKVPLFDNIETVHAKRRNRSTPTSPVVERGTVDFTAQIPEEQKEKEVKVEAEVEVEHFPKALDPAADPIIRPATAQTDHAASSGGLSKLSRRFRAVLASKSEKRAEKKAEKKAEESRRAREASKKDLDRMEDVHWTEM